MKKFLTAIAAFFGFRSATKSDPDELESLMLWISSQKRIDDCQQSAYQALQKKDTVRPGQTHPYEGAILVDCLRVDTILSRHQNEVLRKKVGDASYLFTILDNGINLQLNDATPNNIT